MARSKRRQSLGLDQQLTQEPWRFDFFQAVYLIERLAERGELGRTKLPGHMIGHDTRPDAEPVRFKALASRSFPSGEIADVEFPGDDVPFEKRRAEVTVAFMGLTGPAGALPDGYLELILERLRLRDPALRDFLDLFNHRTISLFYRAWEKNHPSVAFERARLDPKRDDPFGRYLGSFAGIGTSGLQDRLDVPDDLIRFYAGHFSHFPRNPSALAAMLNGFVPMPVELDQFQGDWLDVNRDEQSRLPSAQVPRGVFCQLGRTAMLGDRVFDVQAKFVARFGPMTHEQFENFLPDGEALSKVSSLIRMYVGPELRFVLCLVLKKEEVPQLKLGSSAGHRPRLGWNTWLGEYQKSTDADDARFETTH